jgi:hypothetical protein
MSRKNPRRLLNEKRKKIKTPPGITGDDIARAGKAIRKDTWWAADKNKGK